MRLYGSDSMHLMDDGFGQTVPTTATPTGRQMERPIAPAMLATVPLRSNLRTELGLDMTTAVAHGAPSRICARNMLITECLASNVLYILYHIDNSPSLAKNLFKFSRFLVVCASKSSFESPIPKMLFG